MISKKQGPGEVDVQMADDWEEEQKDAGMNDGGDDEDVDWGLDD